MFSRSIAVALLAITSHSAVSQQPEVGKPFEVQVAESLRIDGLQITFDGVVEDSRCPTGTQCVWAGDATAAFTFEKQPSERTQRTLHTNGRFERQTDYDNFVIRLEDIRPYPKDGVTIAPAEYRATLILTRR